VKKANCPLVPGRVYSFQYPRHNFHGVLSPLEPRRIQVESVRDLVKEPIERQTFDVQPLLKRSRYLVTGVDLEKQAKRSFYVDAMKSLRVLPEVKPKRRQTLSPENKGRSKTR
jgi:hypothetical protein